MDRRQHKSRRAIFDATLSLLERKRWDHVTVQEIIDRADVGRSTFYAHFETKDILLEELCNHVFFHVFGDDPCAWEGDEATLAGRLTHILWHVRESRSNLSAILLSDGGGVFMGYFKRRLRSLLESQLPPHPSELPREYLLSQLVAGFAETVLWWAAEGFGHPPEAVTGYFLQTYGYFWEKLD
jgi:AcrR family transcriptional regulator